MVPCRDQDWSKFYPSYASDADSIAKHKEAEQFWCPDAFDLSIYNKHDSPSNKILSVTFQSCDRRVIPQCVSDSDR